MRGHAHSDAWSVYRIPAHPKHPILYQRLKIAFNKSGMTKTEFADKIGISTPTLASRMFGRREWNLWECYAALDALQIPHNLLHIYFPRNGLDSNIAKENYNGRGSI